MFTVRLDLSDDANAALYYPTEPVGTQMNLFTYIFKLVMAGPNHGGIAAYSYDVNTGSERFDESLRVKPLKFLDDYHIYYERTDRGIHIDDSDIPSAEVKAYYIKESLLLRSEHVFVPYSCAGTLPGDVP